MSYNQIQYQIIQYIISNRVISWSDWQWYRLKEKEKEKEKESQKEIPTDWESEGKKKRIRVRDNMKTLEKRKTVKTKIYQKYVYRGDTKINKMKK